MSRKMQGQAFQQGIDSERQPALPVLQVATPITGLDRPRRSLSRRLRPAAGRRQATKKPRTSPELDNLSASALRSCPPPKPALSLVDEAKRLDNQTASRFAAGLALVRKRLEIRHRNRIVSACGSRTSATGISDARRLLGGPRRACFHPQRPPFDRSATERHGKRPLQPVHATRRRRTTASRIWFCEGKGDAVRQRSGRRLRR